MMRGRAGHTCSRASAARAFAAVVTAACLLLAGVAGGVPVSAVSTVPVTGLPVVSVTLDSGWTLDDVHADKDLEVPSLVSVDDPADVFDVTDAVAEFEGRGNYTWRLDKRPYQIKFESKTSVLGMGAAKKWVLLANHADASLLRNKVAYDLADAVGLPYSPKSEFVDLVVNGQYLGNYLLSEKTEVGTNRVELSDPQGVLLELDNNYGTAEPHYFRSTTTDTIFVLKEAVSDFEDDLIEGDALAGYQDAQAAVNTLDALLHSPDPDWSAISAVIDVDSLARYYIVQELTANSDIGQSSVYFYKDGPGDKLHIGPVWDYDSALGNFSSTALGGNSTESYTKNVTWIKGYGNDWYRQLFRNPEFVVLVNDVYESIGVSAVAGQIAGIDGHAATIAASADANFALWPILGQPSLLFNRDRVYADTWGGEVDYLKSWAAARAAYLAGSYRSGMPVLSYATHVQSIGWQPAVTSGMRAGTEGQSLRMEALELDLSGGTVSGSVEADAHVQGIGWTGWTAEGDLVGTTGQGRRLEAVKLRLTGDLAQAYDLYYRVHSQSYGWLGWAKNGESAGTAGLSKRVEAVEIQLVAKGTTINSSGPAFVQPVASVRYQTHVQSIGWQGWVADGATSGTTGRSLRVEALRATVANAGGGIEYRSHVQGIGWMGWVANGATSGTTGQSRRDEAVQIRLTGAAATNYDVYYRAHVQSLGWLDWASNGDPAGSAGYGYRMEALQVRLVPDGAPAPGPTTRPYLQK